MLALGEYRAGLCPRCGGVLAETTAPENEDAYEGDLPHQCHRCLAFARSTDAYADQPNSHTLLHIVQRRPKRGVTRGPVGEG